MDTDLCGAGKKKKIKKGILEKIQRVISPDVKKM